MIKIHVFYEPLDGPWGGGNQFLKAIRQNFIDNGNHASLEGADAVLVNSHHFESSKNLERLLSHLQENPKIAVIHRVDGPVTLIRGIDEGTDQLIFDFNQRFADATIFQSNWCLKNCQKLGLRVDKPYKVISNAPDPRWFYPKQKAGRGEKIKLVATSWSSSLSKGFSIYQWMDENLNWSQYEMTFVGNTPVSFKNISHVPPLPSHELGNILRDHDIYITASRNDPCSNSLIEAMHCGLPVLALKDGGHPEIIGSAGCCFEHAEDIPALLKILATNYDDFLTKISVQDINQIAQSYTQFVEEISQVTASRKTRMLRDQKRIYLSRYKKKYEQLAIKSLFLKLIAKVKR